MLLAGEAAPELHTAGLPHAGILGMETETDHHIQMLTAASTHAPGANKASSAATSGLCDSKHTVLFQELLCSIASTGNF